MRRGRRGGGGGGAKHKFFVPGPIFGVTTTDDESVDNMQVPGGCGGLWIPSKDRAEMLPGHSQILEEFMAGMEVFVEAEGKRLLGPNYRFLGEYKSSNDHILLNRLKVGNKGSLIVDKKGRGHHHDGKVTVEEKKAVMRHLEGYYLAQEGCRILFLG